MPPLHPHASDMARLRVDSERRLAMLTTSLIFVPNLLALVADRVLASDASQSMLLTQLRFGIAACWVAGLVLLQRARTRPAIRRVNFMLASALVVGVLLLQAIRPEDHGIGQRTTLLVTFLMFAAYPNRPALQVVPWLILVVGSVGLEVTQHGLANRLDVAAFAIQLLLAGGIGGVVSFSRRALERDMAASLDRERAAIEDRERALADLRTLEGIIPICSHCHKIRTEVGDWQGLAQYVRAHTSAEFSHGICPACAAEHYPGMM